MPEESPARKPEPGFVFVGLGMKLRMATPRIPTADTSIAKQPPKVKDHELTTPEFRAWRKVVMARASYRCQWVEHGQRCAKAMPEHRLIADHIIERKDGGAPYDPANGQALCDAHHVRKGNTARAARMAR